MEYVACFMILAISRIETVKIENKISEYFSSDVVQSFKSNWEKYRAPLENAVLRALKENYGYKAMNVYVRRMQDPYKITKGYYHSDNQVQIALADLELDDLPNLWMPEVTFLLPSNVLQIGASLSKMIIRSNYVAFRNKSDIIYDTRDQNFYENSPFRFQQVQNMGQLGITIEGCVLTGMSIATLTGTSVNLGFNSFKLSKCQYTFEISTPGSGSPPVVAKYYPMGTGLNIEHLLMRSLREELMPKLQATMFSFVNTTALLGDVLPVLREKQDELFYYTSHYMNDVVRHLNRIAIEENSGVVDMDDFKLYWDDAFEGKPAYSDISLTKMVMIGLETAYSAHIGGPYKQPHPQISEEIRFSTLRVRGKLSYQSDRKYEYNFVAEMEDVAVEVKFNVNVLKTRKQVLKLKANTNQHRFYIIGWRRIELSIPRVHFIYADALVTGFLLNSIPKYILNYLDENFDKAVEQAGGKNSGKLHFEKNTKDDNQPFTDGSITEEEVSNNKGKKPLYLMTSDEEGNVYVEPHDIEKYSTSNKDHAKENVIPTIDKDYIKRLIGNEDEMIITSGEGITSD